jgi:hypothetical protein
MQDKELLLVWARTEHSESFTDNEGTPSGGAGGKTELRGVASDMVSAIGLIWTDYAQLFDESDLDQKDFPLVEKQNDGEGDYLEVVIEQNVSNEDGQGHYKQTIQWYVEEITLNTLIDED